MMITEDLNKVLAPEMLTVPLPTEGPHSHHPEKSKYFTTTLEDIYHR